MSSSQRSYRFPSRAGRHGLLSAAVVVAVVAVGGCSTDVSRFDLGNYGLSGGDSNNSAAKVPLPSEPLSRPSLGGRIGENFSAPKANAGKGAEDYYGIAAPGWPRKTPKRVVAAAAPPPPAATRQPRYAARNYPGYGSQAPARAAAPARVAVLAPKSSRRQSAGSVIWVKSGDTLYGLARRNGISISALMSANGLTSPRIRPGQKLVLPGAGANLAGSRQPSRAAAASSYVVKSGDSFYRIARKYGIRVAALRQVNGNIDPRRLRPGQVLRIPGAGNGRAYPPQSNDVVARPPRVVSTAQVRGVDAARGIRSITPRARNRVAALRAPAARSSAAKFRWPVKGKVIATFGPRRDGTHNDGINVSVPQGTSVLAADNGVVAYAGSELKGYGNLILIRHDNNWVSAYAHNQSIGVRRGDKIRRGQVIAKAGKTGTVDQPQVHFELRKGSKPVNPLAYLN